MAEWHITPDYIINNWTDELLNLMVEKLVERKQRELEIISKYSIKDSNDRVVSDEHLFRQLGNKIKRVKK